MPVYMCGTYTAYVWKTVAHLCTVSGIEFIRCLSLRVVKDASVLWGGDMYGWGRSVGCGKGDL